MKEDVLEAHARLREPQQVEAPAHDGARQVGAYVLAGLRLDLDADDVVVAVTSGSRRQHARHGPHGVEDRLPLAPHLEPERRRALEAAV